MGNPHSIFNLVRDVWDFLHILFYFLLFLFFLLLGIYVNYTRPSSKIFEIPFGKILLHNILPLISSKYKQSIYYRNYRPYRFVYKQIEMNSSRSPYFALMAKTARFYIKLNTALRIRLAKFYTKRK